jgi:hypothetical protein
MFKFLKNRWRHREAETSSDAGSSDQQNLNNLGVHQEPPLTPPLNEYMQQTAVLRGQIEIARRISADQEAQLNSIAERLGVEPPLDDNYRIYRELWAAENGEQVYLAPIEAPLLLRPDEQCCFFEPAVWGQITPKGYSVFSKTFPMMGASYTIGTAIPHHKALDEIRAMATGFLCITNKRLFFDAGALSTTIPFKRLLNVECYSNGIEINKSGEPNDFFQMTPLASQYAYVAIQETNRLD